jgi:nucleoid DNA-binding protein
MSKINNQVDDMAKELSKKLHLKDGTITIDADAYVQTLPAGINVDTLKQVSEHNAIFYPAITKAFGEKAIKHMAKTKGLEDMSIDVPLYNKDKFSLTIDRESTGRNPKTGEPIISYGKARPSLTIYEASGSRGQMKAVREHLAEQALAAFK